MWVTESGMVKVTKEPHSRNVSGPIWVTEFEMVRSTKELQC